jgi:hypothetical protein
MNNLYIYDRSNYHKLQLSRTTSPDELLMFSPVQIIMGWKEHEEVSPDSPIKYRDNPQSNAEIVNP